MNANVTTLPYDEPALAVLLRVLRRRWWVLALCVIFAAVLGVAYALTAPRLYRAEVLVAPATEDRAGGLGGGDLAKFAAQFSGLASIAGLGASGAGSSKEITIATLSSRGFQAQLVSDLGLMQVFFSDRWNPATRTFSPSWTGAVPAVDDAIKYLNERVFELAEDRKTGLMRVRIDWHDREVAARWANDIVARINLKTRNQAIVESRRSLDFLNEELKKTTNVEVQRSIYGLIEAQVNRIMLANVREQFAFKVIDPAVAPSERNSIKPRKQRIVLLATGAGFVLGAILIFVLEGGLTGGGAQARERRS